MKKIFVATSNPGKLRDFAGAAATHNVEIEPIPNFAKLDPVVEDGTVVGGNGAGGAADIQVRAKDYGIGAVVKQAVGSIGTEHGVIIDEAAVSARLISSARRGDGSRWARKRLDPQCARK